MGKLGNMGFALIGATRVFPLSSFLLSSAREIRFHQGIILLDPGDANSRQPSPSRPSWSTHSPRGHLDGWRRIWGSVAIPGELSAVLTARFRKVCEDGEALPLEKRSGRGVNYFLAQILSVVDPIPGLEWVTLVGFDLDIMVHLLH